MITPEFEYSCYSVLFGKVANYLSKKHKKKIKRAFENYMYLAGGMLSDEHDIDERNEVFILSFWDWVMHTPGAVSGKMTGIDLYLNYDRKLTAYERDMLYRMIRSVVTLFEVTGTGTGTNWVFKDLFLESTPIEKDFLPADMEQSTSLVGGRVISMTSGDEIGHALFPFDPDMKPYLLNELKRSWREFKKTFPGSTKQFFLQFDNPVMRLFFDENTCEGMDTDEDQGDPQLTCYLAAYHVLDAHSLRKSLGNIRHLVNCEDDLFDWYVDKGEEDGLEYAGSIILDGDKLVLNVLTPELRDAGKLMLRSACGKSIRHLLDSTEKESVDDVEID